jgi:hypothetical protein
MGMALAAVADDADLLALDQVQVGVAIVINTHVGFLNRGRNRPVNQAFGWSGPPVAREIPALSRAFSPSWETRFCMAEAGIMRP